MTRADGTRATTPVPMPPPPLRRSAHHEDLPPQGDKARVDTPVSIPEGMRWNSQMMYYSRKHRLWREAQFQYDESPVDVVAETAEGRQTIPRARCRRFLQSRIGTPITPDELRRLAIQERDDVEWWYHLHPGPTGPHIWRHPSYAPARHQDGAATIERDEPAQFPLDIWDGRKQGPVPAAPIEPSESVGGTRTEAPRPISRRIRVCVAGLDGKWHDARAREIPGTDRVIISGDGFENVEVHRVACEVYHEKTGGAPHTRNMARSPEACVNYRREDVVAPIGATHLYAGEGNKWRACFCEGDSVRFTCGYHPRPDLRRLIAFDWTKLNQPLVESEVPVAFESAEAKVDPAFKTETPGSDFEVIEPEAKDMTAPGLEERTEDGSLGRHQPAPDGKPSCLMINTRVPYLLHSGSSVTS